MQRFRRHFLVCISNLPPGMQPSCGARGSADVLSTLERALDRARLREFEGVTATGTTCVGPCDDGPVVLVYPENVWYRGVGVEDVPELVERHAAKGEVVARLLNEDVT